MLDYLLADRNSALSAADISERFGHDASPGTPLHMALATNDKIEVLPDGSFAYKVRSFPPSPRHPLKLRDLAALPLLAGRCYGLKGSLPQPVPLQGYVGAGFLYALSRLLRGPTCQPWTIQPCSQNLMTGP